MAINVWGTQGTVNEVQWAKLAEGFGQKYTLVSGNAVTSSGRNLSIPPRVSIGCGVAVENTTAEAKAVPVPAAGQWFLLVLRRQWGANRGATFELINGPTTTDAAQTTPPTTLPAARNKTPGLIDDEPVAWVHARASTTTLALWQMQTKRDGRVPGLWAMFDPNEQGIFAVTAESDGTEYVYLGNVWQATSGLLSARLSAQQTLGTSWTPISPMSALINTCEATISGATVTLNRPGIILLNAIYQHNGAPSSVLSHAATVNAAAPSTSASTIIDGASTSNGTSLTRTLRVEKNDVLRLFMAGNGISATIKSGFDVAYIR